MAGIYQCVGRYANTPLVIKNTYIRVWCLEELCYYICENADLLDDSFVSNEMLEWLSEECGLRELVQKLVKIRKVSMKLESLVEEILSWAHYVSDEEQKRISRVIRAGRAMPDTRRGMVLADYFLRGGHYVLALHTLESVLNDSGMRGPDAKQKSHILQDMGVIHARMFCFAEAAELFKRAYELDGSRQAMFSWLAAKRMELPDDEYLKFVATLPEDITVPTEVEEEIERIRKDYPGEGREAQLEELRRMRIGSERGEYEGRARRMLEEEKDNYRKYMSE